MDTIKNKNSNNLQSPQPSLRELQHWFQWIMHPDYYVEPKASARHVICGSGKINAQERLSIYSNAYFLRLVEVFEGNFPTTKKILNNEAFQTLVWNYLKDYPSRTTNIDEVGRFLPKFTKTYGRHNDVPYLSEIIALEWNTIESFYANDVLQLDVNALASISEDQWNCAIMTLDPSVKILSFDWPVDELWKEQHNDTFDTIKKKLRQEFIHLCVHRCNDEVFVNRIQKYEYQILNLMQLGHTLSEIAESVNCENDQNVMNCFAHWVQSGIIKKISF